MYKNIFESLLSILWGIYAEVELMDHMVIQYLIFWGTAILFSTVAAPFYISTNNTQWFQFSHIFFFHNGWEVISHCGFDLHFPNHLWFWAYFHVFIGHSYIFFWRNVYSSLCLFFDWVVCFDVELHELFVNFGD